MLFLTVPTAGSHPEVLNKLIEASNLPLTRIVIVATRAGLAFPEGVVVIEDLGPPNIQRWWNAGISASVERGAEVVAVLNDDIQIEPGTLQVMATALVESGATIASPHRPGKKDKVYRRPLIPYEPQIWGCFWLLNVEHDLRPDESYVWWFGDNDLDIRARTQHRGVLNHSVEYSHLFPGEGTEKSIALKALAEKDTEHFQKQYGRMLYWTHWLNRLSAPWRR